MELLPGISGDYFKYQSEALGRPMHIHVRLPIDYGDNEQNYPVVYVLDGDSLFPILASNHIFLHYDDDLPEAIVVGIAYGSFESPANQRQYDFSAPADDEDFPRLREAALNWFDAWKGTEGTPWEVHGVTIEGGTHAADSARSYREGMGWLFDRAE